MRRWDPVRQRHLGRIGNEKGLQTDTILADNSVYRPVGAIHQVIWITSRWMDSISMMWLFFRIVKATHASLKEIKCLCSNIVSFLSRTRVMRLTPSTGQVKLRLSLASTVAKVAVWKLFRSIQSRFRLHVVVVIIMGTGKGWLLGGS